MRYEEHHRYQVAVEEGANSRAQDGRIISRLVRDGDWGRRMIDERAFVLVYSTTKEKRIRREKARLPSDTPYALLRMSKAFLTSFAEFYFTAPFGFEDL